MVGIFPAAGGDVVHCAFATIGYMLHISHIFPLACGYEQVMQAMFVALNRENAVMDPPQ